MDWRPGAFSKSKQDEGILCGFHRARKPCLVTRGRKMRALTVLTNVDSPRVKQRKTHRPRTTESAGDGYLWRWRELPVETFDELAHVLDKIRAGAYSVVVPGRVRDEARERRTITRLKKSKPGRPATLEDAGSTVLCFDLDDTLPIVAPYGWHDVEGLARWAWSVVVERAPALADVSVWWQASGSAGVPGKDKEARLHFFALTDEPLFETQRRALYAIAGTDEGLATTNQKCLIADPAFEGVVDPLANQPRAGVFKGAQDEARTADLLALLPEPDRKVKPQREPRALGPLPDPKTYADTTTSEGEAILERAEQAIAAAEQRNNEINRQAFFVGEAIAAGLINKQEGERRLKIAARASGTARPDEAVDNGLNDGLRSGAPEAPSRAVWRVKRARLPSRRQSDLEGALRGVSGISDAGVVLAVAGALANKIPVAADLSSIRAFLTTHIAPGAVSEEWLDAILKRIRKAVERRRERALEGVSFSTAGRFADDVSHQWIDKLEPLKTITGTTVIRAPMGTGKTQRVGRPFIDAAKATGGEVWAIAHRQSLISELAQRLNLADYREPNTLGAIWEKGGLAVCLPSITLRDFAFEKPRFVFVDEISQVLRFLTARDHCRTRDATAAGVFEHLVEIIRDAEGVLVADAGADDTVLDFLRHCRPGETIKILEMKDPADAEIEAEVYAGSDEIRAQAVDEIAAELVFGGNVWVSCEGAALAQDVGRFLADLVGAESVLVLTADTKLTPDAAAFFADPDRVSRRYRAVVASPVVSSGLSIEHRGNPHFTLGAFLGSGGAIPPPDAAQMLCRVRYLRRFVVGLTFNNRIGGQTVEAILEGRENAANDEGRPVFRKSFDVLVAGYQARSANERADFAAGLWWQLEAAGWRLKRAQAGSGMFAKAKRKIADERRAQRARELMAACSWLAYTSEDEIETLRRNALTTEQQRIVEAWDLTRALGVSTLTEDDIAFVDEGGLGTLDLFEDLIERNVEIETLRPDDERAVLVHRRLRKARRKHFAEIFAGIDLDAEGWLDRETAEIIVDRIEARATAYAASGAVSQRWRARYGEKPAPRPQNALRAVQDMLRRAGLGTMSKRPTKTVRENPDSLITEGASRTKRERIFSLKADDVAAQTVRLEQRRRALKALDPMPDGTHIAHIETAKRIETFAKFGEIRSRKAGFEVETPIPLRLGPVDAVRDELRQAQRRCI